MKRILFLTLAFVLIAAARAQAPIGVCLNNDAQTISNGVIAPIPYATVTMCAQGTITTPMTSSNAAAQIAACTAAKVTTYTTTALSTANPQPFVSDSGGNYFLCLPAGHYSQVINSSYGAFSVPDIAFADNWAAGGTVTGTWTATSFVGPLTGNASTASASDHVPTQCGAGLYSQGDTTAWAANCAQVAYSQVSGIPSLGAMAAGAYPGSGVANSTGSAWGTSWPVAGTGAGLTTGPTSGTTAGHVATFVGTTGQIQDSGTYFTVLSNGYGYWVQYPGGYKREWGCYPSSSSSGFYVQFPSAYTTLASVAPNCTDSKSVTGNPLSCANTTVSGTYAFNSNGDQFCWSSDGY